MFLLITIFLAGIVLTYFSAEWLVRGSSRFAKSFGLSPIIIGLTIVAFGTSLPEFVVSVSAAIKKSGDIALGNILGSCIANIGLVLGISAVISPLKVDMDILKKEVPKMVGAYLVLLLLALDLKISRVDGIILFFGIIILSFLNYHAASRGYNLGNNPDEKPGKLSAYSTPRRNVFLVIVGLIGLTLGAQLIIKSAILVAQRFGISELIIGMTMIAIGTSLPELAVSSVASFRKEAGISIGNLIGSNNFNILLVIGVVSMIHPLSIDKGLLRFEFPVMMVFGIALFPLMRIGYTIGRIKGIALILGYLFFIVYLFSR